MTKVKLVSQEGELAEVLLYLKIQAYLNQVDEEVATKSTLIKNMIEGMLEIF